MGVGVFYLPQMQSSTKEWQRPADWLPMPTNITETDQIFVGLHAVIENSDNYCAFSFTTSGAGIEDRFRSVLIPSSVGKAMGRISDAR